MQLSFDDEEDDSVYGSAEMEKMENRPLAVDNTVHGHVGLASAVATPSSAIRSGKKRPVINMKSGSDSCPRRFSVILSSLVSLMVVCRRWWW